jgi:hypothetical protein
MQTFITRLLSQVNDLDIDVSIMIDDKTCEECGAIPHGRHEELQALQKKIVALFNSIREEGNI